MSPSRRDFLRTLSATPLALSPAMAATPQRSSTRQRERPNVLVLMSDNHSWDHLGCYGDPVVRTPNTDRVAAAGVRFTNAYCAAPSCAPARAAMLTGQEIWRLEEGGNLWGVLPDRHPVYTDLLAASGYDVGCQGKGWGPGSVAMSGRVTNHAGPRYASFEHFLEARPGDGPWTFWASHPNPHRPYEVGSGTAAGLDPGGVRVPAYLPDVPEVRGDILDYYREIEQFDAHVGAVLDLLERSGDAGNTLIVICSDNGWQMPRGLANLYDFGTRVPLVVSWPGQISGGRVVDDFVTLNDLAPTFLELAGLTPPPVMTARSMVGLLTSERSGRIEERRDRVFTARERHALCRQHGMGYPARAIRTHEFLYVRNYEPERWPAGDPPLYGDVDPNFYQYPGPTKIYMMLHREEPAVRPLFEMAFGKRPAEELFDLRRDPEQMINVAGRPEYAATRASLADQLEGYLRETLDPRVVGGPLVWDTAMYYNVRTLYEQRPLPEYVELLGLDEAYHFMLPVSNGLEVPR